MKKFTTTSERDTIPTGMSLTEYVRNWSSSEEVIIGWDEAPTKNGFKPRIGYLVPSEELKTEMEKMENDRKKTSVEKIDTSKMQNITELLEGIKVAHQYFGIGTVISIKN